MLPRFPPEPRILGTSRTHEQLHVMCLDVAGI